jgi:hypothetical protein
LAYVCGLFYLCTTALAVGYGPQQYRLNEMLYGAVLIAFFADIVLRRGPVYRSVLRLARGGTP